MAPAITRTSEKSRSPLWSPVPDRRPNALAQDPPTLLFLRAQCEAKTSKDPIAVKVATPDSQSTYDTTFGTTMNGASFETTDDSFMGGVEGSATIAESELIDAADGIEMSVRICGTVLVCGVLYYRLHTPIRNNMIASVLRSYSDFVKLDNAIAASRCSRRAVPFTRGSLPGAEVVGLRRSLNKEKFLQRRQDMLQQYLDGIATQWPVASQDQCVQEFLHRGAIREAPMQTALGQLRTALWDFSHKKPVQDQEHDARRELAIQLVG